MINIDNIRKAIIAGALAFGGCSVQSGVFMNEGCALPNKEEPDNSGGLAALKHAQSVEPLSIEGNLQAPLLSRQIASIHDSKQHEVKGIHLLDTLIDLGEPTYVPSKALF